MEGEKSIGHLPRDSQSSDAGKMSNEETQRPGNHMIKDFRRNKVRSNISNDSEKDLRPSEYLMEMPGRKKKKKKDIAYSSIPNWRNDKPKNSEEILENSNSTKVENPPNTILNTDEGEKHNNSEKLSCYEMANEIMELYDFIKMNGQLYLYCDQEGFWRMIQESEAHREIRSIIPSYFRHKVSKNSLYEIYEWLRTYSEERDDTTPERKYYINFADCALDWRKEGGLIEKRKNLLFRYALHVRIDGIENKENGVYARFIQDLFGDDIKTKKEFRKFIGLCISDIRFLKVCFFFYGLPNTGKTVVLNLLKKLLGPEWCSSLSFSQMSNEFAITQLLGKRLNLSGEVSGASNKRLDIFKSLTGNDMITACFKGKDHFQFRNESILVFACNSFPGISSLEEFDSFLSRIIIFPFFNVKPRNEWIDNLEDILLEDVYAIILDAVQGLRELEEDGYCFKESRAMKECKQSFVSQYNSFALFADEFIIQNPESRITSDEIRKKYFAFCEERGYLALPDNVWSQYLKQKFVCVAKTFEVQENGQKLRHRGYQGIGLRHKSET